MDFFGLFRSTPPENNSSNNGMSPTPAQVSQSFMPKLAVNFSMESVSSSKKSLNFPNLPLEERVRCLLDQDNYDEVYWSAVDKKIQAIKQENLEFVKKEHPELAGKIGLKNIRLSDDAFFSLQDDISATLIEYLFKKEEVKEAKAHLLDPQKKLSSLDRGILKICMSIWEHNPEFLVEHYGIRTRAFHAMLAKEETDLTDIMGKALKSDARTVVGFGISCCREVKGLDRGQTAMAADRWVAKWLNPVMVKSLTQAKILVPKEGSKTEKPTIEDIKQTQRYQFQFKATLLYYFYKSPAQAQNVFRLILPYIPKMDSDIQGQMWGILFDKYRAAPDIRDEVIKSMASFLSQNEDRKTQRIMYGSFVKVLPKEKRAEILGAMPFKTLKKYWKTFAPAYKGLLYAPLQIDTDQTYLAWRLFQEKELSDEQMKTLLEKTDPKKHSAFLFSPKKNIDKDIFKHMCGVFAKQPFYFWKWVHSFRGVKNFPNSLAEVYLTLPESLRNSKYYVGSLNVQFGLIRKCAEIGDIAGLSAIKKVLGSDVFWQSLNQAGKDKISGARSLCRQGKRGLLRWMSDWPIQKKQEFFMTADKNGRTLLEECTGNLARMVVQDVFKQAYQKEVIPDVVPETPIVQESEPQTQTTTKSVSRQILRIPLFEDHISKIETNSKLVQEVEEAISALSKMSKAEIAKELKEGLKHHGHLEKEPCAVKDIRGNNYRLGYLLRGDVDNGTGQIAFLFFLTHGQYNKFLNRQAAQAVRTAVAMMQNNPPPSQNAPSLSFRLHGNDGPDGP